MKRKSFLALLASIIVAPFVPVNRNPVEQKEVLGEVDSIPDKGTFLIIQDKNNDYWIHKSNESGWEKLEVNGFALAEDD